MKFSDLVIPTKEVNVTPGQAITVRGVSYLDMVTALTDHSPAIKSAYEAFEDRRMSGEPFTQEVVIDMLKKIIRETPDAMAAIICIAADDYNPEAMEKVKKLGMASQVLFLGAIIELTMSGEADIKKVEAMVLGAIQKLTETVRGTIASALKDGASPSDGA